MAKYKYIGSSPCKLFTGKVLKTFQYGDEEEIDEKHLFGNTNFILIPSKKKGKED